MNMHKSLYKQVLAFQNSLLILEITILNLENLLVLLFHDLSINNNNNKLKKIRNKNEKNLVIIYNEI